jgi:predicted nucleic acid-binding protein
MAELKTEALIYDSSVYIPAIRNSEFSLLATTARVWISSVVLHELRVGAGTKEAIKLVDLLYRKFTRLNRILTPTAGDWYTAGSIVEKVSSKYRYETKGRAALTNDSLIAVSARNRGLVIVTRNIKDFKRLADFIPFSFRSPN